MVTLNTTTSGLWGRDASARQDLVRQLVENLGTTVTRKQVLSFVGTLGKTNADVRWLFNNKMFRAGRGQYTLQPLLASSDSAVASPVAN